MRVSLLPCSVFTRFSLLPCRWRLFCLFIVGPVVHRRSRDREHDLFSTGQGRPRMPMGCLKLSDGESALPTVPAHNAHGLRPRIRELFCLALFMVAVGVACMMAVTLCGDSPSSEDSACWLLSSLRFIARVLDVCMTDLGEDAGAFGRR